MDEYFIFKIQRFKDYTIIRDLDAHCERRRDHYNTNRDIDISKSENNYHLKECTKTYTQYVKDRLEEVKPKTISNRSNLLCNVMVTTSPGWMERQDLATQKQFFQITYDFFKELLGDENICSAVVHMDEKTPHMHLSFVPLTQDGRLHMSDALHLVNDRTGLSRLQTELFNKVHDQFPDLMRGRDKIITQARDIHMTLYKEMHEYYEEYFDLAKRIQELPNVENKEEEARSILVGLNRCIPKIATLKKEIGALGEVNESSMDEIELWKEQYNLLVNKHESLLSETKELREAVDVLQLWHENCVRTLEDKVGRSGVELVKELDEMTFRAIRKAEPSQETTLVR